MTKRAEYMRAWRIDRYIKGLCQECSSPVYLQGTRCRKHAILHAKFTMEWKRRECETKSYQRIKFAS